MDYEFIVYESKSFNHFRSQLSGVMNGVSFHNKTIHWISFFRKILNNTNFADTVSRLEIIIFLSLTIGDRF